MQYGKYNGDSLLSQPYSDELRGLAEVAGIPVDELSMLTISRLAACSS